MQKNPRKLHRFCIVAILPCVTVSKLSLLVAGKHKVTRLEPFFILWLILLVSFNLNSSSLDECAEQFIASNVKNAPFIEGSVAGKPYGNNLHLCFKGKESSFYAIEYKPSVFAPRWAAYKLSPENYGKNGCNTFTRSMNNCYLKAPTWQEALDCNNSSYESDPFHKEPLVGAGGLSSNPFSSTGHDRGHTAPRNAFSWSVCATYLTFSMANMSPQRAWLNQKIWMYLEQQVLTWAFENGPIYVVTGTTYNSFPYDKFGVYQDKTLNAEEGYQQTQKLEVTAAQNEYNYRTYPIGNLLRPKRNSQAKKVKSKVKGLQVPTGYYKVLYRPAIGDTPELAIGFLVPHTYENLNELTEHYKMGPLRKNEDFWFFRARIDLIEETAKVQFPSIPKHLKSSYNAGDWWDSKRNGRNIRSTSCGRGTPAGEIKNSTASERLKACTIPMSNSKHLKP